MPAEVTRLLEAIEHGDSRAAEDLLPLVYQELRRLASARMRQEPSNHTLQATALVHEAWLRLAGENHSWKNRSHFFSAAAEAMRRILIERARRKQRIRHGGGQIRVQIDSIDIAKDEDPDTLLFVHEALERLERTDPSAANLVKLRFFAGIPNHQAAEMLGMSERTAKRNWAYARAWLANAIREIQPPSGL